MKMSSLKKRGGKPLKEGKEDPTTASNAKSIAQIFISSPWPMILALIFGGCCSNVFTLEALVSEQKDSGHLLTATQFLFVAIEGLVHFFDPTQPANLFLAPRKVPLVKWLLPVSLFFTVSLLNNYVWVYHISVPVHIIFRSGGTLTTMVAGMIVGKKYTPYQILSVVVLTAGVIIATLASSPGGDNSKEKDTTGTPLQFAIGVSILAVAAICSSIQGLIAEKIYKQYGKHWRESLFYTHALGLPFFFFFRKDIIRQLGLVLSSEPMNLQTPLERYIPALESLSTSAPKFSMLLTPPRRLVLLLANAFTQYICVRGVNNLAGNSTALTVTIVLNVRKFVSLLLSIYLFGNSLSILTMLGTVLVFAGAGMYSYSSSISTKSKTA